VGRGTWKDKRGKESRVPLVADRSLVTAGLGPRLPDPTEQAPKVSARPFKGRFSARACLFTDLAKILSLMRSRDRIGTFSVTQ
jgi:hypothetical protein